MTQLFAPSDANPHRVFKAALAVCIPIWETEREKKQSAWNRRWSLGEGSPAVLMALAAANASMELRDADSPEVRTCANDYLRYLWYSRNHTFASTVNDLLDHHADLGPCVQLHGNLKSQSLWYYVPELAAKTACMELLDDVVLALFMDTIERIYPLLTLLELEKGTAKLVEESMEAFLKSREAA